jgi:hypothetical protein
MHDTAHPSVAAEIDGNDSPTLGTDHGAVSVSPQPLRDRLEIGIVGLCSGRLPPPIAQGNVELAVQAEPAA